MVLTYVVITSQMNGNHSYTSPLDQSFCDGGNSARPAVTLLPEGGTEMRRNSGRQSV